MQHVPVLLQEVLGILAPKPGETVLDVTVGLGGHAEAFIEAIGKEGKFVGLEADGENLRNAKLKIQNSECKNVSLIHTNFRLLSELDLPKVNVLFADLGLSSPHIDVPERGFTFSADAPLDMRYDRSAGRTAAEILNRNSEVTLHEILQKYGEIPRAAALAKAIVSQRRVRAFERSSDLLGLVEEVCGRESPEVLPQVFQALRIAVNDELGALRILLSEGPGLLAPRGRMGVISYHSLEDRMVKQAFRELTVPVKDAVTGRAVGQPGFHLLTKRSITPGEAETAANPRSRSAHLRAIQRFS